MRIIGIFFIGFGIVLLVPVVFVFIEGQAIAGLVCSVLLAAMMFVGVALTRRVEDTARGRNHEPESPPLSHASANPIRRARDNFYSFDFNRLNWIGWTLLVTTFGFVGGMSWVGTLLVPDDVAREQAIPLIGFVLLFSTIAYFAGMRWLLSVLGISIYRW